MWNTVTFPLHTRISYYSHRIYRTAALASQSNTFLTKRFQIAAILMRDQLIKRSIHEEEPGIRPGILATLTDEPIHGEQTMICSTTVT